MIWNIVRAVIPAEIISRGHISHHGAGNNLDTVIERRRRLLTWSITDLVDGDRQSALPTLPCHTQ